MAGDTMDRKQFVTALGAGLGGCMCASVLAVRAAIGAEAPKPAAPAKPVTTMAGEKTPARALKRIESIDAWVPSFFGLLDQQVDEPTRRRLMEATGQACFVRNNPEQPRRPEPASNEKIAAWVKSRAAYGYAMDGDAIVVTFLGSPENGWPAGVCGCPVVEAQSQKTMSPTFCWCSAGNVRELHERVFGRPVKVELLESVLLGQQHCKHRITLV